jgi:hypothetical protein
MRELIRDYSVSMRRGEFERAKDQLANLQRGYSGCYSIHDFHDADPQTYQFSRSKPYILWPSFYRRLYRTLSEAVRLSEYGAYRMMWPVGLYELKVGDVKYHVLAIPTDLGGGVTVVFDDEGTQTQRSWGIPGFTAAVVEPPEFLGSEVLRWHDINSNVPKHYFQYIDDGELRWLSIRHSRGDVAKPSPSGGSGWYRRGATIGGSHNCEFTSDGATCKGHSHKPSRQGNLLWRSAYKWDDQSQLLVETSYEETFRPHNDPAD